MKKYSESDNYILFQGNMLDILQEIEENSIDSIVTDPPYELNFMNKSWDNSGIAFQKETWQKCYEVLKSGGYLLAFGGTRTYHRIACAIENAGCFRDDDWQPKDIEVTVNGRFPANVILTYDETDFEEVCGGMPYTNSGKPHARKGTHFGINIQKDNRENNKLSGFNDSGSASRYFYCAKASKKDRDEGLDEFEEKIDCDRDPSLASANVPMNRSGNARKNTHPTVKPTELMQYLIRLVTPKNGIVLDPFMGSGSTGKACMYENKERNANYKFIGVELTEEYLPIAEARINYANQQAIEENREKQLSIFEMER